MKLIVSDIDGTLSHEGEPIPIEVANKLEEEVLKGNQIILVTGRTYHFAEPLLINLNFPYYLGLYNGALLIKMPSKETVRKNFLSMETVKAIHPYFQEEGAQFLVEAGMESDGACFYLKDLFSHELLTYFNKRKGREPWIHINSLHEIYLEDIAMLKCFGHKLLLEKIKNKLTPLFALDMCVIEDPYQLYYVLLVNAKEVNKGTLLDQFLHNQNFDEIIVCGNDLNDLPMMRYATQKVVIEGSPEAILKIADIIVPKPSEQGILKVLL